MMSRTDWIEILRKYKTVVDLKRSALFAEWGEQIESFLETPQLRSFPGATPCLDSFLRVVQWNIEKGKRFSAILDQSGYSKTPSRGGVLFETRQ